MTGEDYRLFFACLACVRDACSECVALTVGAFCPHACFWIYLPIEMGEPVNEKPSTDDDYSDDVADDQAVSDDLPEPTDPAQVSPDEGDAGAEK